MINIQTILNNENLTIYGASQLIAAETDEGLKTIHRRLTCWIRAEPRQWTDLDTFLDIMGYQIEITKKGSSKLPKITKFPEDEGFYGMTDTEKREILEKCQ
jgi:hypothetical protein